MTNNDWQRVSQVLGVLLVVLVAGSAFVVLSRSSSPGAGASPTLIAAASPTRSAKPSGSLAPGATETPEASPSPTDEATPTATSEESPSPEVTPTPEVTVEPSPTETASPTDIIQGPTAPTVSIRFQDLGFDSAASTTPTARTFTFRSEGPGEVAVHLTHTSEGEVRLCLQPKDGQEQCRELAKIDLVGSTDEAGKTTWTVTAMGLGGGFPIADVRIVFRTTRPAMTIDGFRFQGAHLRGYNGVEAEFDVGDGTVHADGHWDGVNVSWRAELTDMATQELLGSDSGSGNNLQLDAGVTKRRVHLSLRNSEDFADQEVFLHALIRWP